MDANRRKELHDRLIAVTEEFANDGISFVGAIAVKDEDNWTVAIGDAEVVIDHGGIELAATCFHMLAAVTSALREELE